MPTPLHVHSLHALAYCERLFYLEEVENLRVADERVYAGRRLHVEIEREEDDSEWLQLSFESARWGLVGKVDCIRHRDGMLIPYEHKRGRAHHNDSGIPDVWPSDHLQIIGYAALVEEHSGRPVTEGRIRYHADNITVRVAIDDEARRYLADSISRARELQASVIRPPVTENEKLCANCSLAPVCLPEEARLAEHLIPQVKPSDKRKVSNSPQRLIRLFPADDDRQTLHVVTPGARAARKGHRIEVVPPKGSDLAITLHPIITLYELLIVPSPGVIPWDVAVIVCVRTGYLFCPKLSPFAE